MSDPAHRPPAPLRASRFRHEEEALADTLASLLGREASSLAFADLARADALAAEFLASHDALEQRQEVAEEAWPQAQVQLAVDTMHRVSRNLGSRPVWLIVSLSDPHVVALPSEMVLDNPLGFAGLGDRELRLLDRELPAGFWLLRHSETGSDATEYTWELLAWGEPWGSATTRALRGIG